MRASTFGTGPSAVSAAGNSGSIGALGLGAVARRCRGAIETGSGARGGVEEGGGCTGGEEDSQWREVITLRFVQRGPGNRRLRSQVRAGLHSRAAPPTLCTHTGLFFASAMHTNTHTHAQWGKSLQKYVVFHRVGVSRIHVFFFSEKLPLLCSLA